MLLNWYSIRLLTSMHQKNVLTSMLKSCGFGSKAIKATHKWSGAWTWFDLTKRYELSIFLLCIHLLFTLLKNLNKVQGTKIHETIKKNLILVFESLFDEGVIRNISSSDISRNEGDYMLVPHKDKTNFYKTTTIRVSTNFIDRVDSSHFASFPDLLANNFDTRIAFSMFFIIVFSYLYTLFFNVTHIFIIY